MQVDQQLAILHQPLVEPGAALDVDCDDLIADGGSIWLVLHGIDVGERTPPCPSDGSQSRRSDSTRRPAHLRYHLPAPGREPEHGDVGFAIAVVVTGYGNVAAGSPAGGVPSPDVPGAGGGRNTEMSVGSRRTKLAGCPAKEVFMSGSPSWATETTPSSAVKTGTPMACSWKLRMRESMPVW